MRIERSGVVGLLEIQTRGGGRSVVELTEKFYEQTKVLIAGSAPPSLRELYPKEGYLIDILAYITTYLNTKLNVSKQSRPILDRDCPKLRSSCLWHNEQG
jgi:hypothetical protein